MLFNFSRDLPLDHFFLAPLAPEDLAALLEAWICLDLPPAFSFGG